MRNATSRATAPGVPTLFPPGTWSSHCTAGSSFCSEAESLTERNQSFSWEPRIQPESKLGEYKKGTEAVSKALVENRNDRGGQWVGPPNKALGLLSYLTPSWTLLEKLPQFSLTSQLFLPLSATLAIPLSYFLLYLSL